ncbi:MAG: hypothetical protein NVS2B8_01160 [Vulcanimicrobiaceae bacterium]
MPTLHFLVDCDDPLFAQDDVHHAIEALDREGGIYVGREHRTPESILTWIDYHFGGTSAHEAAAGGVWIAQVEGRPIGFAAFDARGLRYADVRFWQTRDGVGLVGPLGVLPAYRNRGIGGVLARAACFAMGERGYRQAVFAGVDVAGAAFLERHVGARFVQSIDERSERRYRTTVLASGAGSNFASVLAAAARGDVPLAIEALVVNRPNAGALAHAAAAGVPSYVVAWDRSAESRDDFDERVVRTVAGSEPELVLLLGWMHVLPATFLARFPETLNLHPATLPLDPSRDTVTMPDGRVIPAYRGARAFDEALASGRGWSGATVHTVGVAVDRGAVYARAPIALVGDASRDELETRLHAREQEVVATAIRRWARERP